MPGLYKWLAVFFDFMTLVALVWAAYMFAVTGGFAALVTSNLIVAVIMLALAALALFVYPRIPYVGKGDLKIELLLIAIAAALINFSVFMPVPVFYPHDVSHEAYLVVACLLVLWHTWQLSPGAIRAVKRKRQQRRTSGDRSLHEAA